MSEIWAQMRTALLTAIVLSAVGKVLPSAIDMFWEVFCSRLTITQADLVNLTDQFVLRTCYSRSYNNYLTPGNGCHVYLGGVAILYRYDSLNGAQYIIYATSENILRKVHKKITSREAEFTVYQIISTTAWQHQVVHKPISLHDTVYPYQQDLVDEILDLYQVKKYVNVLLCGGTGTGKSSVGRFLLKAMQNHNAILIEGFDPTVAGLSFTLHVLKERPDPSVPLIVTIDEIDIAMNKTVSEECDRDYVAHSSNKIRFNAFLDQLKDTPNLITICTSNCQLNELREQFPEYTREGRLTKWCEFSA
jgi:hypothetical protein